MNTINLKNIMQSKKNQMIAFLSALVFACGISMTMVSQGADVEGALREHVQSQIIQDIKRAESVMGAFNRNAKKTSKEALNGIKSQVAAWDITISDTQKKEDGSYVGYASMKGTLTNSDNGVKNDVNQNVKFEYVIIDGEVRIQKLDMVR